MKIGLLAPPWVAVPPSGYGGTELVIDQLGRALTDLGHEVTLFATGDSTSRVKTDSVIDVAPGVHVGGAAVELYQVIAGYAAFESFDIVHDHTTIGPSYAQYHVRGPVVTTNHNPFVEPFCAIYRSLNGEIPIVAVSHHHAGTATPIEISAVIHHGIDVEDYPFSPTSGEFALLLGRMSPDKGVVEAIRIAHAAGIPLLIGAKMISADEVDYFHTEVEPLLGESCTYLGEVDHAQKRHLLSSARCLLNPITWDEPFGLAMIESLACGTPVVARRRGSVPEIVKDGVVGLLGETDEDLTVALSRIDRIDRAACRSYVTAEFGAKRMAEAHLSLYRRVISRSSSREIVNR